MKRHLDFAYFYLRNTSIKFHLKSLILLSGIFFLILTQTDFSLQSNYISLIAFLCIYYSISFLVTKKISFKTLSRQIAIVLIWISVTSVLLYLLITANYIALPVIYAYPVFSIYKMGFIFSLSSVIFIYTSVAHLIKTNIELKDLHKKNKLENDLLRLSFLRAQMNPHFISNCLVNLSDTIRLGQTDNAIQYNSSLLNLLRYQLENADKKMVPLAEELDWLKQYIEIEIKRRPGLFDYIIEYNNADTHELFIPPMMLQPFVENSIKHAFVPFGDNRRGKLIIRILQTSDEMYYIEIEDNGKNQKLDLERNLLPNNKSKSIAIKNIKERIKLLKFTSPFSITLKTQSSDIGFCVKLGIDQKL